jgi:hypothetical protein
VLKAEGGQAMQFGVFGWGHGGFAKERVFNCLYIQYIKPPKTRKPLAEAVAQVE